jgi:predicted transcriptional regulator
MHHILEYEDFLASLGIIVEASKKDAKVLDKLIDSNLKNSQEMKKIVGQWKKAEGQERSDLTSKLKELTAAKQEVEKKIAAEVEELDKGIGLEVVTEALKDNLYLQLHKKYAEQIQGLKAKKIKKLTDLVSVQRWAMENQDDYLDMSPVDRKKMSAVFNDERKLFKQYMAGDHSVMLPESVIIS